MLIFGGDQKMAEERAAPRRRARPAKLSEGQAAGVAALDRSTSVAHQLGDAIRPYIQSFGAGLVLGGLFAAGLDAVREVRRTR